MSKSNLIQLKKLCLPEGEDSFSYRRINGPELDAAAAGTVHFLHGSPIVEDLAAGGKVGARHCGENVVLRILQKGDGGFADFLQIEAADV